VPPLGDAVGLVVSFAPGRSAGCPEAQPVALSHALSEGVRYELDRGPALNGPDFSNSQHQLPHPNLTFSPSRVTQAESVVVKATLRAWIGLRKV
jgi:hypothetical protein